MKRRKERHGNPKWSGYDPGPKHKWVYIVETKWGTHHSLVKPPEGVKYKRVNRDKHEGKLRLRRAKLAKRKASAKKRPLSAWMRFWVQASKRGLTMKQASALFKKRPHAFKTAFKSAKSKMARGRKKR